MSGPRRIAVPSPVTVRAGPRGRPLAVAGRPVGSVRDSWLVEEGWWTDRPLRRRYWEIVTTCGRDLVVYRDLVRGRWFMQR